MKEGTQEVEDKNEAKEKVRGRKEGKKEDREGKVTEGGEKRVKSVIGV